MSKDNCVSFGKYLTHWVISNKASLNANKDREWWDANEREYSYEEIYDEFIKYNTGHPNPKNNPFPTVGFPNGFDHHAHPQS